MFIGNAAKAVSSSVGSNRVGLANASINGISSQVMKQRNSQNTQAYNYLKSSGRMVRGTNLTPTEVRDFSNPQPSNVPLKPMTQPMLGSQINLSNQTNLAKQPTLQLNSNHLGPLNHKSMQAPNKLNGFQIVQQSHTNPAQQTLL